MSTLNVANISDDQSTLTGSNENPKDKLHFNATIDTKYVTNGCAKAFCRGAANGGIMNSLNISSLTHNGTGEYDYNITNAYASDSSFTQTATALAGLSNVRWAQGNSTITNASTLAIITRNSAGTVIDTWQSATSFGDLA